MMFWIAYVNKNYDKAKEVWEKDEQVDDLTYIAMESVIDFLSKDKKNLDFSTHLIFATKNLKELVIILLILQRQFVI